jgi:eukaryotic-like serine/threonine-protein kinase
VSGWWQNNCPGDKTVGSALMKAPESKLPRSVGRYHIIRELGKGAMGRVLLAHDPVLEREVAIKHLRSDLPIAPEQRAQLLERMRQEARASARVSHPNLVALHDMGETPDLGLYLVFEYVEGPNLKERLETGPLGAEAVATIAREVGLGLRLLHEAGVIHRDIKPENMILSKTGAKLTDFGIARVPDSTLTGAGNVLGTPAYSAPEAIRSSQFSPRSDQFSLAATLYEALSGRRAFPGDDAVFVATQIANTEPPKVAALCGVPLAVDAALARGLCKNPQARFEDCEQFGGALAEALVPTPRTTQPPLPEHRQVFIPTPPPSRSRLRSVLSALAFLGIGAWFGTRWLAQDEPLLGEPRGAAAPRTAALEDTIPAVAWLAERPKQLPRREGESTEEVLDDESEEPTGAAGSGNKPPLVAPAEPELARPQTGEHNRSALPERTVKPKPTKPVVHPKRATRREPR